MNSYEIKSLYQNSPQVDNLSNSQLKDIEDAENYESIYGSNGNIPALIKIILDLDKKLNKLIIFVLCGIICSTLLGCNRIETQESEREIPPGYHILCDGNGKFGIQYPDGNISLTIMFSRRAAIDFAWHTTKPFEPEPTPDWKVCD